MPGMENETLLDDDIRNELTVLYRAADRHYHGLDHVEALLALWREHRALIDDPAAIEAAIWFHDAVYDSQRNDNEHLSALLAREKLAGRVPEDRLERIVAMIEATATHTPPVAGDPQGFGDAALFLDMDLSILGAPPAAFDAYEEAIRREYAWVDDAAWRKGRAGVLRRFAERPRLYLTDTFRQNLEAPARRNIERSLASLSG
jgi:predicted metal-dependent HD superfamily phosphohydrolase